VGDFIVAVTDKLLMDYIFSKNNSILVYMRYLLLMATILSGSFSFAQRKFFSYNPLYVQNFKSFIITEEKTNSLYVVAVDKNYVDRIYVTPSGKINLLHQGILKDEQFRINHRLDEKMQSVFFQHKYVAGHVSGTKMLDVLQHRHSDDLLLIETDLSTGTSVCTDTIELVRKDDLIFSYARNNRLYLVEKPKDKSFLLFHSKVFSKKPARDTVNMDMLSAVNATNNISGHTKDFDNATVGVDVQVLPNNLWLPVHALSYRNKAFIQQDKFYVTINNKDFSAWLLSFDLISLAYDVKKYDAHVSNFKLKGPASSTTLVVDSFLITGVSNKKEIYYSVYNINSGSLLHSQIINEQNLSEVSTSPIMKVGDFWSRSNLSEVELKGFVNKSIENQLIINGYREKDQLFLTFGSKYQGLTTATFLGNLFTLGMGGFAQVKPPSAVYFHIALQLSSFKASKSIVKDIVWDKMLQHLFANRGTYEGLKVCYMNGFYYMGYVNIHKREYQLYKFDEKMQ